MKTSHTPEKTAPASTFYGFTEDDVRDALLAYVASRGDKAPSGEINMWAEDQSVHCPSGNYVTMTITHDGSTPEPEPEKSIRATCYDAISDAVDSLMPSHVRLCDAERSRDDVFRAIDDALQAKKAEVVRDCCEAIDGIRAVSPHDGSVHYSANPIEAILHETGVTP